MGVNGRLFIFKNSAAKGRLMRRFFSFVSTLMLVVMLWAGTMAHAAEAMQCAEVSADAAGHFEGDGDEVPADPETGVPHHHAGCHGHHVGVAADANAPENAPASTASLALGREAMASGCDPGAALRPPIA